MRTTQKACMELLSLMCQENHVKIEYDMVGNTISGVKILLNKENTEEECNDAINNLLIMHLTLVEAVLTLVAGFNDTQPLPQRAKLLNAVKHVLIDQVRDRYKSAIDNNLRRLEIVT